MSIRIGGFERNADGNWQNAESVASDTLKDVLDDAEMQIVLHVQARWAPKFDLDTRLEEIEERLDTHHHRIAKTQQDLSREIDIRRHHSCPSTSSHSLAR
ncbi:MAG: hypothetical protein CME04_19690 [Gemmatimonadaceae bacterium]|jgi:reverse gyrase|nr:hypothetical protein [Gemmatimonadaceae bacterium]